MKINQNSASGIFIILCGIFFLGTATLSVGQNTRVDVKLGYLDSTVPVIDVESAMVALELWAQDMAHQLDDSIVVGSKIYPDIEAMKIDLIHGGNYLFVLPLLLYKQYKLENLVEPIFILTQSEDKFERYFLMVNKDSNINSLADLKNKSMIVQGTQSQESVGYQWLNLLLYRENKPEAGAYLKSVKLKIKVTEVALPVFFKTTDACVIKDRAWKTLTELNPAIKEEFKLLAQSPGYMTHVMVVNKTIKPVLREEIIRICNNIMDLPRGTQLLALFQMVGFLEIKPEYFTTIDSLLLELNHLKMQNKSMRR